MSRIVVGKTAKKKEVVKREEKEPISEQVKVEVQNPAIPERRLSFSAVEMYLKCGEQFRRRYVLGDKVKPSIAMIDGHAYHDSAAKANLDKRDGVRVWNPNQMLDQYVINLREGVDKNPEMSWEGENEHNLIRKARVLWPDFSRNVYDKTNPDLVEHKVEQNVEVEGVKIPMIGVVDLTTKKKGEKHWSNHVYDYKTSSRAKSQKDVDQSVQLDLYSHFTGLRESGLITFVKTANPYIAVVRSRRNPGQIAWTLQVVLSVWRCIKSGAFPLANPDAGSWWCSERFCGYWPTCRGKGHAK